MVGGTEIAGEPRMHLPHSLAIGTPTFRCCSLSPPRAWCVISICQGGGSINWTMIQPTSTVFEDPELSFSDSKPGLLDQMTGHCSVSSRVVVRKDSLCHASSTAWQSVSFD